MLFAFVCLGFYACEQKLELTIPQDQLILIMADMNMAEASMQRMTSKMKDTLAVRYYNEIYEIHEINQELYLENLKVLEKKPKLAKKIFDSVLEKIGEEENREIQSQKDLTPKEKETQK